MTYLSYEGFETWFYYSSDNDDDHNNQHYFDTFEKRLFEVSPAGERLGSIALGMLLLYEIPVSFLTPSLHDTLMTIHHIAMILVACLGVGIFSPNGDPVGTYYLSFYFGVIELSSVFLAVASLFHPKKGKHWHDFMNNINGPGGDVLRSSIKVCRILFCIAFLILRTIYFPIVISSSVWDFWNGYNLPDDKRYGVSKWIFLSTCVVCFLFSFLQLFWGLLVAKVLARDIGLIIDDENKKATTKEGKNI